MSNPFFPFETRLHRDVARNSIHPIDFLSTTDPSLSEANSVVAGKRWRQPNALPDYTKYKDWVRNEANDDWVFCGAWTVDEYTDGQVPIADIDGYLTPGSPSPGPHATSHEDGGSDEIDVTGLSGLLADGQTPLAHAATHENGGSDEISVAGLSGLLGDPQTPTTHATSHQNGGGDEISVAGLSGTLADPQTPTTHAASHADAGSDPVNVTGLDGFTGDTTKFLRADGSFQVPPGTSTGTVDGSGTATKIPKWSDSDTLTDSAVTENSGNLTSTKALILPASTTSIASINLPHGSAPTSPTDGDAWTTTAGIFVRVNGATIGPLVATGGGGGLAQAYVGYDTVGASSESMVGRRWYLKKVTIATACLLTDIEAYIDAGGGVDQVDSMAAALFSDNSGSPLTLLSYCPSPSSSLLPDSVTGAGGDTTGRWHGRPIGRWVTAADYWLCVGCPELTVGSIRIFYDSSGSDKHFAAGGDWITDAGFTTVSDNSKKYSIRANTIR